jgi:hypothetical protein
MTYLGSFALYRLDSPRWFAWKRVGPIEVHITFGWWKIHWWQRRGK